MRCRREQIVIRSGNGKREGHSLTQAYLRQKHSNRLRGGNSQLRQNSLGIFLQLTVHTGSNNGFFHVAQCGTLEPFSQPENFAYTFFRFENAVFGREND